MADLFSVTAPLAIRFKDTGAKQIMVKRLSCNGGLLYLPTFWTDMEPQQALRYVAGPIEGAGPWKVGNAIVTVLACHGTDAVLANDFACWQSRLMEPGYDYPDESDIVLLMKTYAASIAGISEPPSEFQKPRSNNA